MSRTDKEGLIEEKRGSGDDDDDDERDREKSFHMQRGQLSQKSGETEAAVVDWSILGNVFNSIGLYAVPTLSQTSQNPNHHVFGVRRAVSGGNEALGVTTADVAGICDGRKSYLYSISRPQVNIDASSFEAREIQGQFPFLINLLWLVFIIYS